MSDQTDGPNRPDAAIVALRLIASMMASIVAFLLALYAVRQMVLWTAALRQPLCPSMAYGWMAAAAVLAAIACLGIVAITVPIGRGRFRLIGVIVLASIMSIAAWTNATIWNPPIVHRANSIIIENLRGLAQGMIAARIDGKDCSATFLLLLHDQYASPRVFFDDRLACPVCPPSPSADGFNYQGITPEDAFLQRVPGQAIVDAANAVLADAQWERIGWLWLLRDWASVPEHTHPTAGRFPVGIAACSPGQGVGLYVLWADGRVEYHRWIELFQEVLSEQVSEGLSVTQPPQELVDYLNEAFSSR